MGGGGGSGPLALYNKIVVKNLGVLFEKNF